ncbi:hypothetical protein [Couchioplanes caeruleus]|uniref:Uncharacterized protein n=2 Tax=Couchioplanes caeruleus TaxID=56438 RepID=A0A1K0FPB4_9ACTN|nr:hypothetical protein [Couchioplanes caeruleus]OJF14685.1 hypothetical protein BG844_08590 [Couchioplanes caeruleus subsp. caeruleus]ROP30084.1 hypothetical protein EDD30_2916 [Couchioplanes caeruleus]
MRAGITGRVARVRTATARATVLPLLVRGGIGLAFLAALLVAWPVSLVLSRSVALLAVVAVYPALAPRGRGPTVAALTVVGGWILDTTWYDARIALWRVLAVATLLYAGHTLSALAAVLPYDAVVTADVVTAWLARAGAVVLGSAVLTVIALGLTAGLAGPAFVLASLVGLAAAVGLTLLLARLLRRA